MSFLKQIEKTDVFQFLGLVLIGTGLFFWKGIGAALTILGVLVFIIGFLPGILPLFSKGVFPKVKK